MNDTDLLANVNSLARDTMLEALGIKISRYERGYVEGTMPVDHRTKQPYGLLHGGASATLAETLGSFGSHLISSESGKLSVGIELNINHLRSTKSGIVTGKATLLHEGKSLHVWTIDIHDEEGRLIATSRHTVMIREGIR